MAIRRVVIIFSLVLAGMGAASAAQMPCRTEAEYRALLGSVAQRSAQPNASFADLANEVPEQCAVAIASRTFQISNQQLRADLREIAKLEDSEARRPLLKSLAGSVQRRLDGLNAFERGVDSAAQPKLQEIMNRREFRRVGGQDSKVILQEWLVRLAERLFAHVLKNPDQAALAAKLFVWSLCLLVVGLLLRALYRWALGWAKEEAVREPIPDAPSAKSLRQWLDEAREAAARGELREAVHRGYWAVISHLESSGAWRPDRARTPREYLRLLAQTSPARPLLGELTRDFETIWYGNRTLEMAEWQTFLAKVEQIGCH